MHDADFKVYESVTSQSIDSLFDGNAARLRTMHPDLSHLNICILPVNKYPDQMRNYSSSINNQCILKPLLLVQNAAQ